MNMHNSFPDRSVTAETIYDNIISVDMTQF